MGLSAGYYYAKSSYTQSEGLLVGAGPVSQTAPQKQWREQEQHRPVSTTRAFSRYLARWPAARPAS